jgi:DNA-directed RNA polymerase subunit K/omega
MIDYKKSKAPSNTITRDLNSLAERTGNIYETIAIISKRSNQIQKEMKEELDKKLDEFAYYADNYEEVFENREQIEISKFYERLPKPVNIAMQEYLNEEIYFRNPTQED